ncbi:MAG: acetamidase/formamidase family protein [Alphaproteobacteria bacterium]
MQRLTRDRHTFVLDPKAKPIMTVTSGEEFVVETWDAYMGRWAPEDEPTHLGPAAGPIAVEGAMPGDVLRVDLLDIKPVQVKPEGMAVHDVTKGRGFLGSEFTRHVPTVMQMQDGELIFPGGIRLPVTPSLGYVATTFTEFRETNTDSGPNGGDIDIKELTAGSSIWLPVFQPGGLLCVGDCHATLGDGCVGGTAAECASESRLRVTLEKGMTLDRPRALTPEFFITICYGQDLGEAMRQAVRDMVKFLVEEKGMEPYTAYTLLSLGADIRISRAFRPVSPVKLLLRRSVLDQIETARA